MSDSVHTSTRLDKAGLADTDGAPGQQPWTEILRGIVGSHAYGLATPESDIDRMSVALAPSESFFGFNPPVGRSATRVRHEPEDYVIHELGKFLSLAMKSNPSILELLWIEEWEVMTQTGEELVNIRRAFPSKRLVRDAYLGYAHQQLTRLVLRGDGTFSSDTRNRSLKHARHLLRLVQQGLHLYGTGEIAVKVTDPDALRALAEDILRDPEIGKAYLEQADHEFKVTTSPLPDEPARAEIEEWLKAVRINHLFNRPV